MKHSDTEARSFDWITKVRRRAKDTKESLGEIGVCGWSVESAENEEWIGVFSNYKLELSIRNNA